MKVCDVVINSIWYDPRVRKQIAEYERRGVELSCVGFHCARYNEEEVAHLPVKTTIATIREDLLGKQKGAVRKIVRDMLTNRAVRDAIIQYQPDIIHANDLNALIPAYAAARKLKCRLVYDSHEICVENHTGKRRKVFQAYMKWEEQHIVKKIDLMVSVSNAAADYFANEYNIKRPMVVTHGPLQNEIVGISNVKNEGFEVLNHGQFYAGRGYDIMVEAAALLKEYPEIRMALRGFGVLEDKLKNRAKQLNLDNVIFYPRVHVEELIPMASHSMVGLAVTEPICLNFKLSVSNKLFEYASAGLPVIMSDIPEHRYLNDKYHFGVVIPQNTPEVLAKAVLQLYQDRTLYETLSKNACRMAEDLAWEKDFGRLIDAERKMVE